ncbi:MAG: hypothetical protein NT070_17615 [Cyanobacteria bacterium]|nr:hypothetical protein [Cyanobacteriota bacterium]
MSTSIAELLPAISDLSPADKFQLVQLVLAQLAQQDIIQNGQPSQPFNPCSFFGVTHQPKQVIDDYLTNAREGWL